MRRFQVWRAVGVVAAFLLATHSLRAQGYSVNEHSTCAMGRAGTATASPCPDGSAMFFNPAGLADWKAGQTTITAGGTLIVPRGGFTADATGFDDRLKNGAYPVPAVYVTRGLTDKLAAGLGLFAPYGLTTEWPTTAQGRFLGYRSHISAVYLQPTVAYKVGEYVQLGAGFDLNFMAVELRQRVDLADQRLPPSPQVPPGTTFGDVGIPTGTDFADAQLTASSTGVGYHVGVIIRATPKLSFGARYLSRQKVTFNDGRVKIRQVPTGLVMAPGNPLNLPAGFHLDNALALQFQPGGPLVDQGAKTILRMPEQLSFGVAYKPIEKLQLLGDITMTNWKVFQTLPLDFEILPDTALIEDYHRSYAYRIGAEYAIAAGTAIRAGYINHTAAAPSKTVTPNLPEGPRAEFTVGFGTRLTRGLQLDLAYQYIDQADRRGRSGPDGTPNNGLYDFYAHLFGASLTYTF